MPRNTGLPAGPPRTRNILCRKEIHDSHPWLRVYPLTQCPGYRGSRPRRLWCWLTEGW